MVDVSKRAERGPIALPSLTGMRFIAAAIVFFAHASHTNMFASPAAAKNFALIFSQAGNAAVGFFFLLSGFIMTWSARRSDTTRTFYRRRVFRIWPNHVVTFLAAYMLLTWVTNLPIDNREAGLNLLLVQAWFPSMGTIFSVNSVTWSMSVEVLFYFAFPFLLRLANRISAERLWAWAGGIVAIILAIPIIATTLPDQPVVPMAGPEKHFWFMNFFPLVRMLEFGLGILLARIVITGRKLPLSLGGSVAFAVLVCALAPMFPWSYQLVAIMTLPLALVIASAAVADVEKRPSVLSSRPAVWLGQLAFGFYLWHVMVIFYGHQLLSPSKDEVVILPLLGLGKSWSTPVALAVLALFFGVTLLLSWALFSLVERPVYRRFATARRRPARVEETAPLGPAVEQIPADQVTSGANPAGEPTGRLS